MNDQNKNRSGYRKTKAGWIPELWEYTPAGDLFDIQLGKMLNKAARNGDNPQPYLANYNVRWGAFELTEVQRMSFNAKELQKFELRQGDLLVCEGGEVGRCAVWEGQVKPCYYQKALHRVRPAVDNIDVYYVMYYLHHVVSSPMMVNFVGQTSISHFTRTQFLKLPVIVPPLEEQKKIAEIIAVWDKAIAQLRKVNSALERRKRALMQQLLTGKQRLNGFKSAWRRHALGQLFTERAETRCGHLPLLAITGKNGVVPAASMVRRDSSSADKSRYKRIVPGDIGYNTMRMWQGVCAISGLEGIVSPAYTVCIPSAGVDAVFMGYLFKFPPVIHLFHRYSQGLVNDTLNLKFHHFAQIKVRIPDIAEQQAIAASLSALDDEIDLQKKKLAAVEKQKRGLMQKLLTGEVRTRQSFNSVKV